jgi:hypothetical protein
MALSFRGSTDAGAAMKKFKCQKCLNTIYFENIGCVRCQSPLGFFPPQLQLIALTALPDGTFKPVKGSAGRLKRCANAQHGTCNWLLSARDPSSLCVACALNRTIPDLSDAANLAAWSELELAKKRLVYSLLRAGLPMHGVNGKPALQFDFLKDAPTGHLDGVITVDISEADTIEREKQRAHFSERYRTLLGHLRHETGHYYWSQFIDGTAAIDSFRRLFGDERQDYQAALQRHHAEGPPADWAQHFVSAYASVHPWEDWAETWAHYLHMVESLDTAEAQGIEPRLAGLFGSTFKLKTYDVYTAETFPALVERWVPLTLALNTLNRSMGHGDFYPFVVPPAALQKMAFVHDTVRRNQNARALPKAS